MIYLLSKFMIILLAALCSIEAYAFTDKDEQMLKKINYMGEKTLLHEDKWRVEPSKLDLDGHVYKGESKSLIDWNDMNHSKWLDFNYWREQREQRDKLPQWKVKLRESRHAELVGRVLKCIGKCEVYRGENSTNGQYLSRILEGDELITNEHSYAWLVLSDGSIARISPKTSLTFNEINITNKDIFYSIRLNHGHIHWQVRNLGAFDKINLAETDLAFYPIMERKANREHHSRLEYISMDENQKLIYLSRNNYGFNSQYEKLNSLLVESDNYLSKVNTNVFMVTPNSTYYVQNSHFDLYFSINSISAFRYKTNLSGFEKNDSRQVKASAFLRGYSNKTQKDLSAKQWYTVNKDGSSISESDIGKKFASIDLFTKRIPTIHLARELMLKKRFTHLFKKTFTSKELIQKYGHRLWTDDETTRRLKFLKEYTRRIETTNLFSLKKVFSLEKVDTFNTEYYSLALNKQLNKLKTKYSKKRMIIPELNDIEYYIWTLKYAKNKK
jgi:hypothetical protein